MNPPYAIRRHDDQTKGYAAFSAKNIKSGELVLLEHPILVYPQASMVQQICNHCLKDLKSDVNLDGEPRRSEERTTSTSLSTPTETLPMSSTKSPVVPCRSCGVARFCNEACHQAALIDPGSHSTVSCAMIRAACFDGADDETISALHMLSRLFALLLSARLGDSGALRRYEAFMSLSDGNGASILEDQDYTTWLDDVCARFATCLARIQEGTLLQGLPGMGVAQLPEANPEFIKNACLKDLVNAYGIRAPLRFSSDCGVLRGTALYSEASRFNHECLPNVARCEDFDQSPLMKFVALHDLPEGEEITQSYFPLDWEVEDRQNRCRSVYGFRCTCPRCLLEGSHGLQPSLEAEQEQQDAVNAGQIDDGYVAVFLIKYLCVDEACEGTMVPVLGDSNKTLVCNVCGRARTEAQFLLSLAEP